MSTPQQLKRNILSDMKVELTQMFDRNFEGKGFFGKKWMPTKKPSHIGSLLVRSSRMRNSIRSIIVGNGVKFTSSMPYTSIHNEGGKFTQSVRAHIRKSKKTGKSHQVKPFTRNINMPQRQLIGNHNKVEQAIKKICVDNATEYFNNLAKELKK